MVVHNSNANTQETEAGRPKDQCQTYYLVRLWVEKRKERRKREMRDEGEEERRGGGDWEKEEKEGLIEEEGMGEERGRKEDRRVY